MAERVFTLTELTRTGAARPGGAVFRWTPEEHAAPVGDIPLELAIHSIRRAVPGGVEVVEQVTAATWEPFTVHGEWSDKWLPAGAMATFETFSAFVARVPLVRMEFERLELTGIIENLRIRYRRRAIIGWEITFSPHRLGTGIVRVEIRSVTPLGQHVAGFLAAVAGLEERRAKVAALARKDGILDGVDGALQSVVDRANDARAVVEDGLLQDATSSLLHTATTLRGVRDAAHGMALAVLKARSDLSVAYDSVLTDLAFISQVRNAAADAWRLVADAARAESDARTLARAAPQAIHRPARGESLYHISERYYGTPDEWRLIYEANHLSSLRLEGTEELIIPERSA